MYQSTLNSAIIQVSRSLSIDTKLVDKIVKSYWKFISDKLENNKSFKGMDEEEFNENALNFNIPFIGKLYTDYSKVNSYNNHIKFKKDDTSKKD